jgi:hypothetical protein
MFPVTYAGQAKGIVILTEWLKERVQDYIVSKVREQEVCMKYVMHDFWLSHWLC